MPHTINGIGTNYIGKRNLRTYVGVCDQCKREVQLQEYDTRLWFTIVFIPVIPLARKHVVNFCTSCTYHYALSEDQWRQVSRESVDEAVKEAEARPEDPETAVNLIGSLGAFASPEEAEPKIRDVARRFHNNPDVLLAAAEWYDRAGRGEEADILCDQAFKADPNHAGARIAVAVGKIQDNQPDQARDLLRPLEDSGDRVDATPFIMLGAAYQARGDHERALEAFATAQRMAPSLGKDGPFRKMVRLSEKVSGRETILPRRSLFSSKLFWVGAFVLLVAAGVIGVDRYAAARRKLYIVNGLPGKVTVRFDDDEPIELRPGAKRSIRISDGTHSVKAVGPNGMEETGELALDGRFFLRAFEGRTHVYCPFAAAPILWDKVYYVPQGREGPLGESELHVGRLLRFEDIDYEFEPFPGEIEVENSGNVPRTRLSLPDGSSEPWAFINASFRDDVKVVGDAMKYGQAHLAARPDDDRLLASCFSAAYLQDRLPEFRDFLAGRLDDRPVRVQWHRLYQEACDRTGRAEQVRSMYERLLRREPGNSLMMYLSGRLETLASRSLALMDRAISADPGNPHPWRAKAFALQSLGRFEEAYEAGARAIAADPDDGEIRSMVYGIGLAAGKAREVIEGCRRAMADDPDVYEWTQRLIEAHAARGRWTDARRAARKWRLHLNHDVPEGTVVECVWAERLVDFLGGRFDPVSRERDLSPYEPPLARELMFLAAVEAGRPEDATRHMEQMLKPLWRHYLALALAFGAEGRKARADEWRRKAVEQLAEGGAEERLAGRLLGEGPAADAKTAADVMLFAHEKALFLTAMVQGGADASLLDLAAKLNVTPVSCRGMIARTVSGLISPTP